MNRDFLAEFPIPSHLLPAKLQALLTPVGLIPTEMVEVSSRFDSDPAVKPREYAYMAMAVVPEGAAADCLSNLRGTVLVAESKPVLREKGNVENFAPCLAGQDYIVASWGSGSSYTYNLAEKVWMALGLVPRCLGNTEQRLAYDDLSLPSFDVADGDVSAEFHWEASRNIRWRMRNDYLRRYLWLRGAVGVRCFYYQGTVEDRAEIRGLMGGKAHVCIGARDSWFEVDIREHDGRLVLQVWAAVVAVACERSAEPSAEGLVWPGIADPVTSDRANAWLASPTVYLDDRFLERYEQNLYYGSLPLYYGQWLCNPSYRGQWAFSDCRRAGRNIIEVPLREIYKPKPDSEILHAHAFAITPEEAQARGLDGEHVANKTHRLLQQLLDLGDNLSKLGHVAGIEKSPADWVGFDRAKLDYYGWTAYGQLGRLAQVAPLQMTQQAFLSRCKSLHEIWQRIPDGLLRQLLHAAGVPKDPSKGLKSLKLLEALLNVTQRMGAQQERVDSLLSKEAPEGWSERNPNMAPLFLNNDLRIADAHEAVSEAIKTLEKMGFEVASLKAGYGLALDFVFDGVIRAFESVNQALGSLLSR
ncbi:hypothetical protein [Paracidovorax wautersii]|uniref:Uncharacterized protein n=1 Tax=Paracidovorax wautersii TaxID=1177982 RepID=A0A1I2FT14_9BURK|nr:hypothetical protein [Paracidovorax wautersii]SFF08584.1 hypothetical protein SAMN04489711_1123 [Paracidovorax wautersii]